LNCDFTTHAKMWLLIFCKLKYVLILQCWVGVGMNPIACWAFHHCCKFSKYYRHNWLPTGCL